MTTTRLAPTSDALSRGGAVPGGARSGHLDRVPQRSARQKQETLWALHFPISLRPASLDAHHQLSDDASACRAVPFCARHSSRTMMCARRARRPFTPIGTVAAIRFVADGEHPFTGIFATGAVGFMRASLAVGMPNYSPAAALKFLLDGPHPSAEHAAAPIAGQAGQPGFLRTRAHQSHHGTHHLSEHAHVAAPESSGSPRSRTRSSCNVSITWPLSRTTAPAVEHAVRRSWCTCTARMKSATTPRRPPTFDRFSREIPSGSLLYRMYGKAARAPSRSTSARSRSSLNSSRRNSATASWPSSMPGP